MVQQTNCRVFARKLILHDLQRDMRIFLFIILASSMLVASSAQSQESDVFVNVRGGDRLHFHVLKGQGIPVLFEAGGGDDATVWTNIEKPIRDITGATLITYDRAGFGQSELNANDREIPRHGILNGIEELEIALKQLGYDGDIMLVAHSYGALYATVYAARHPDSVKAAVLVDGSSACWFDDDWMKNFVRGRKDQPSLAEKPGAFYQSENLPKTIEIVRERPFPSSIPVIDLVSEFPPFSSDKDIFRWKNCHRQFVNAQANRQGITAYGTGHYIYKDNPPLVIDSVVKAYIGIVDRQKAFDIMRREVDYAIEAANERGQRVGASRR
jgi:pimeloyl-ACP methyl ester carboxylesterase